MKKTRKNIARKEKLGGRRRRIGKKKNWEEEEKGRRTRKTL